MFKIDKERLLNLFFELVRIDSETRKERPMADRLKAELERLGFKVTEDDTGQKIGGNAGNLIAVLPGKAAGNSLLLCAHMDRVTPGEGIEPVLVDGIIRSKGETILAGDDIAGVAAILEALQVIQEKDLNHPELKVLFTVAEEGGLNGVKNVDREAIKADYGLCYDSTGDVGTVVFQGPAQYRFQAVIKGKAAHAGVNPAAGINAIKVASLAINQMKLGQIDQETTANIGKIKGGQATNIVPDRVEIIGEARSRNQEKLDAQIAHMKDITERSAKKYGAQAEITTELIYPALYFPTDHPLIERAKKAFTALQIKTDLVSSGGGCDANIINGYGIPTINLGIGIENPHSVDEQITVENLMKTAEFTLAMIQLAVNTSS